MRISQTTTLIGLKTQSAFVHGRPEKESHFFVKSECLARDVKYFCIFVRAEWLQVAVVYLNAVPNHPASYFSSRLPAPA